MTDALKILGTLFVAGVLNLALTNTRVSDVASSARNNIALNQNGSTAFALTNGELENSKTNTFALNNEGTFVSEQKIVTQDGRVFIVKGNETQTVNGNTVVVSNNYNDMTRDENIGRFVDSQDNRQAISGSAFANSASLDDSRGEIVVRARGNSLGTASVANAGILSDGNGINYGLLLLFIGLLVLAVFLFRLTDRKKNRLVPGYGYAPVPRYYDVPAAAYPMAAPVHPIYQNPEPIAHAAVPDTSAKTPEYRINLG